MILNDGQVREKIDKIFAADSGSPEQVYGAAYDLRLASWPLVTSDDVVHNEQNPHRTPLILHPGEVASVATVEQFQMPPNLSATISLKFSAVRQGLLILHGGMVHPGFGAGVPDQRLYFLVANVSRAAVALYPEVDSLASLQFHEITPVAVTDTPNRDAGAGRDGPGAKPNRDATAWRERPPEAQLIGLRYFEDIRSLRKEVETVGNRTRDVVVFGVFVLGFALVGAIAAAVAAILAGDAPTGRAHLIDVPSWGFLLIMAAAVVTVVAALLIAWRGWFPLRVPREGLRIRVAMDHSLRRRHEELSDAMRSLAQIEQRIGRLEAGTKQRARDT